MAKSNKVLFEHVQRYLSFGKLESHLKKLKDVEAEAIKKELENRNCEFGPIEEFDGPNGGITYTSQKTLVFDKELVERVLGKEIAESCTVRVVNAEAVKAICKAKKMTDEKIKSMCSTVKKTTKLMPVYGRVNNEKTFSIDVSNILNKS